MNGAFLPEGERVQAGEVGAIYVEGAEPEQALVLESGEASDDQSLRTVS